MTNFFGDFKIKHVDLPHIFIYLGLYAILLIAALLITTATTAILVAISCLVILVLILNYHFYRSNEIVARVQQQKNQAYFSLFNLIDFRLPLPYMSGWAATPELALAIYNTIKTTKPTTIVELGSGISSLICCYGIEQNEHGKLYSLDHDKSYGAKTANMLAAHAVSENSNVIYAPLKPQQIDGRNYIWYDCSAFNIPKKIDLLIIDGPPFKTQSEARYPALDYFYHHLAEKTTIIIHDTHRKEESSIIKKWKKKYTDLSKLTINSEKGITILKR